MISNAQRAIITITVITASVMQLIDTSIVNVALPHVMGNLGADLDDASWVITAYIFANVIVVPMTGWLAAFFGRKRYYLASIIIFVIASMFCGQATNIWELVFFRFVQGIGGGGLLPTSRVILVESFPPEDLALANGLFGMGVVSGPLIGPVLGGWLTTHFTWRWIFYVNLPVGLIALLLAAANVKEPQDQKHPGRVDWWGLFWLFVGFGALQIVLERGEKDNWFQSNFILILAILAVVGIVAFVVQEFTTDKPVVDLRVLRHKNLAIGVLLGFVMGFSIYTTVFLFPVFAQNLLGYSALQTGLILLPGALTAAIMMPTVGVLLKKGVPPQLMASAGFLIFFIFTFLLSKQNLNSGPHNFFLPVILRGVGLGSLSVPVNTIALTGVFGHDLSEGSGFLSMTRQLGGSFGTAMIATFVDWREAFHRNQMVAHLTHYSYATRHWINIFMHRFYSLGSSMFTAKLQGWKVIAFGLAQQSMLMTYDEAFIAVGFFALFCIPLILLTFGKTESPEKYKEKKQKKSKKKQQMATEPG
ncbi:MAG TPA: DHA2 family efflux MFS transporter permease subunit [Balneolales bacterium]|nr:DHA2 family efflux MFS transporter permease subunit [Balneolales bacterium]